MKKKNLILQTDSYKTSHWLQYPPNTSNVFSYIESRGGEHAYTVMFGLQYIIKEYLTRQVTQEDIDQAQKVLTAHGVPFHKEGWQYIVNELNGYLPLRIKAVPEGTVVPTHNVLVTVENTDPKCYWLTSYVEPVCMKDWYPITVATQSRVMKQTIARFLEETADNLDGLPFKLHDFGYRGVSSEESAAIGGAAHLVNFMGTDNLAALSFLEEYYGGEIAEGVSIPASEHSTVTVWGQENEAKMFENMVDAYADQPIFACVSDSYDIFAAPEKWGKLKDKLTKNETLLVVRPDSGDPEEVSVKTIELLDKEFGSTTNSKGYKVLNGVRVIYGDGIRSPRVVHDLLANLRLRKYSAENMAFGMGGGLLQMVNRDTLQFAMKCSSAIVDGKQVDVYKDPVTDPGKKSKRGRLDLVKVDGEFKTVREEETDLPSELITVYENGKLLVEQTIGEIRERAAL